MYALYVISVMALAGFAVWVLLRFNVVFQKQKQIHESWIVVDEILAERNNLLGQFQELWVRMFARPEEVTAFQTALADDTVVFWEDLANRALIRDYVEEIAATLFNEVMTHPVGAQDTDFTRLRRELHENTEDLQNELLTFNQLVRIYNHLLKIFPNKYTASYWHAFPIGYFRVKLAQF